MKRRRRAIGCFIAATLVFGLAPKAFGITSTTTDPDTVTDYINQLDIPNPEKREALDAANSAYEALEDLPAITYEEYVRIHGQENAERDILKIDDPDKLIERSATDSGITRFQYTNPRYPETTWEYTLYRDMDNLVKACVEKIITTNFTDTHGIPRKVDDYTVGTIALREGPSEGIRELQTHLNSAETVIISGLKVGKILLSTTPQHKKVLVTDCEIQDGVYLFRLSKLETASVLNCGDSKVLFDECPKLKNGVNTEEFNHGIEPIVIPEVANRFEISSDRIKIKEAYNSFSIKAPFSATRAAQEAPSQDWKEWMLSVDPNLTDEELVALFNEGIKESEAAGFVDACSTRSSRTQGAVAYEKDPTGELLTLSYELNTANSPLNRTAFYRKSFSLELPSGTIVQNVENLSDENTKDKLSRMLVSMPTQWDNRSYAGFSNLKVVDATTGEILPFETRFSYDESSKSLHVDVAVSGTASLSSTSYSPRVVFWGSALDYRHFFESSYFVERGGQHPIALQVNPKMYAQWDFPQAAWESLRLQHIGNHVMLTSRGYIARFQLVNPCEYQFYCHIQFAGFIKTPWNLEYSRPHNSYAETIAAKCNP